MKSQEPIAIVGMAGIFPDAFDLDSFWQMITAGRSTVREVNPERWKIPKAKMVANAPFPDKAYSAHCSLIEGFVFNSRGIDLPGLSLADLDPLHQMVLHAGREAIAGLSDAALPREGTRVILAAIALPTDGAVRISRKIFGRKSQATINLQARTNGNKPAVIPSPEERMAARPVGLPAALLAQAFNLQGGAFTLDAACASSLYAVKLACDALQSHQVDAVLAGGVSRPDCLYSQVGFSQLKALSSTGKCAPFDANADGLVVGEGVGILVLKRLSDAVINQDTILGVVRGIGLSNDMRGNLLAPEVEGQLRAMQAAYRSAGWQPPDVDLIECHGAGTPLGDLTELKSLKRLWQDVAWQAHQCPIGSVKSNIGHLLTASGAAGMIKVLLSLKHRQLPPSANFIQPAQNSPLMDGPFRVQTEPADWPRRSPALPRRAAVSAFGFGGINAHLLIEEWLPTQSSIQVQQAVRPRDAGFGTSSLASPACPEIAIVGMATQIGRLSSLEQFKRGIFNADSAISRRPPHRWKGIEQHDINGLKLSDLFGAFLKELSIDLGDFRIPPNEISDILPQHLLMLKVAAQAMADARMIHRVPQPRMGAIIGIDFDYEATNFHLRWISNHPETLGPPLTSTRTLGALGSMVASRLAREFRFGGPSFTVSGEETSGLHALQIGIDALEKSELDAVLVGAVDLTGDLRRVLTARALNDYSQDMCVRPFDDRATGTLCGEGAVALVIKRLDRAIADGNRMYAVIKGTGCASGPSPNNKPLPEETIVLSIQRAFRTAVIESQTVGYIETHGSGISSEDTSEALALHQVFEGRRKSVAVGATKHVVGHIGAAAGLASVIKAALCLYHELIPPLWPIEKPVRAPWQNGPLHLPFEPQFWSRNRNEGPRRVLAAAHTGDGTCMHVLLEGLDFDACTPMHADIRQKIESERRQPLGKYPFGLFVVAASDNDRLVPALDRFEGRLINWMTSGRNEIAIDDIARRWFLEDNQYQNEASRLVLLAKDVHNLTDLIAEARRCVALRRQRSANADRGVWYLPNFDGGSDRLAFVFPGSGNHYLGMGREIGIWWPEILRQIDSESLQFKSQAQPEYFMPWQTAWPPGWQTAAYKSIISHPFFIIVGHVSHGDIVCRLLRYFGINPRAAIGYSLGEVTALVALNAWPGRDAVYERMKASELFTSGLVAPYSAARCAWKIPPDQSVDWRVAVVRCPPGQVRRKCREWKTARLLIINTPQECVIGGLQADVEGVINDLASDAAYLDGISTVHCDALKPEAQAYYDLHLLPVNPPARVRFYSCAAASAYPLTSDAAAESILNQNLEGFDFSAVIEAAYADGIRIFVETGPGASCTRMIHKILGNRPYLAVSTSDKGESELLKVMKALAALLAAGVPIDLTKLYKDSVEAHSPQVDLTTTGEPICIPVGGVPLPPPELEAASVDNLSKNSGVPFENIDILALPDLMDGQVQTIQSTTRAHESFLIFTNEITRAAAQAFSLQNRLLSAVGCIKSDGQYTFKHRPAFTRDQCLEFARESAARVLGPEFVAVDTFPLRVRLPDEPLMLVDRIMAIEGRKGSLNSGRVITEHDVLPQAWYLDGDRAPACISIEAGQADLFLCAYLGIDLAVAGRRAYRLLDATVTFHRGLPRPGETIRYDIHIDKFIRQGEVYMFLFRFKGQIGGKPLITMTDGRAGFFTPEEISSSGGILSNADEQAGSVTMHKQDWQYLVPVQPTQFNEMQLDALRRGDVGACFGKNFAGIELPDAQKLPGGRMRLIHRIRYLDPSGGRFGLGFILAEADVRPDDWFLTCHFVDDRVMPGTLMYECCVHAFRVLLQRFGWITDRPEDCWEPVVGVPATLKCRGPVTPETRQVLYQIEIKKIGYRPQPHAIADAHMYADGKYIVRFVDISLQLSGTNHEHLESFWQQRRCLAETKGTEPNRLPVFNRHHLETFASGKPSAAFGKPYRIFDQERFIARLPRPPFLFIDRIVKVEPDPWILKPDGWIEAEYELQPNDWYFRANRCPMIPLGILMEIALQPCGWLAAYMGSALKSDKGLRFRNLGGEATVLQHLAPEAGFLSVRTRLTRVSEIDDMIIEHFEFQVTCRNQPVYNGTTYFGFFTRKALAQQEGLQMSPSPDPFGSSQLSGGNYHKFEDLAPLFPEDPEESHGPSAAYPAKALRMIDWIDVYYPKGGLHGVGYIRATKVIDPNEWFFKAHFYQDPVCPGSLGVEGFIQLLKFVAVKRYGQKLAGHWIGFLPAERHTWIYRGQILPGNRHVTVEADITAIVESPEPVIRADGILSVDGLAIYRLENFGICMVPRRI